MFLRYWFSKYKIANWIDGFNAVGRKYNDTKQILTKILPIQASCQKWDDFLHKIIRQRNRHKQLKLKSKLSEVFKTAEKNKTFLRAI